MHRGVRVVQHGCSDEETKTHPGALPALDTSQGLMDAVKQATENHDLVSKQIKWNAECNPNRLTLTVENTAFPMFRPQNGYRRCYRSTPSLVTGDYPFTCDAPNPFDASLLIHRVCWCTSLPMPPSAPVVSPPPLPPPPVPPSYAAGWYFSGNQLRLHGWVPDV